MRKLAVRAVWACSVVLITYGSPLAAQEEESTEENATGAAPASEEQGFKEEVTVTARKREEGIQDVPFSVAAPTEEDLRDRGAETLEDVSANVAGFNVQNLGPGQSQVAMRGVSAGQIVRDQPGVKEQVGVYLDESVISLSLFTPDIDLFDMNRIEVLRGPQGTLFGSGSLSGTVRYITNQPELGVSESFGEFSLSSIDGSELGSAAKAAVNTPLGDSAAVRISAYHNEIEGYIDAVQPDLSVKESVNGGSRTGARIAFLLEPSDQLKVTPRVIYQEVDMDGWNRIDDYNILGNPFTTTRPAVDLGEREQFTQIGEPFSDDFLLADLDVEYTFASGQTLTSITSYIDRDILVVRDATALTASITGGTPLHFPESVYSLDAPLDDATQASTLTEELRLAGSTDRLDWVGGIFYSTVDRDYGQSLLVTGFEAMTGIPTAGSFGAGRDVLYFSDLSYDLDQTAVFGEVTYAVTDRFDLTGGLRYYDFSEDRTQTFDGIFSDPGTTVGSVEADGLAPRLVASFELNDATTLNAQISKGFRLGGINDPLNVPLCSGDDLITFGGRETWKDEELWNYEVGSKSTIMGGRGIFNVAAFYADISDLQATVTAGTCSSRIIFNVPKARATGLELELSGQPSSAFDFAISASYNDSQLRSTVTRIGSSGAPEVVAGIEAGNRLPTVPELQAAAAATYRWDLRPDWTTYLTGTYQHVGSRFTQIGDQAAGFGTVNLVPEGFTPLGGPLTASEFTFDPELPAYDLLNLRYGFLHGRWDVALFVNNVTDERALLALDQERGTLARVGYLTNPPRTFGVSSRVRF
ncbi:MAG: TonB-dependent receptor [Thermoanaerobaculia bacterium]